MHLARHGLGNRVDWWTYILGNLWWLHPRWIVRTSICCSTFTTDMTSASSDLVVWAVASGCMPVWLSDLCHVHQGCHSLCCSGAWCFSGISTHVVNHLLEEFVNMLIVEVTRYVHAWTSMSVNTHVSWCTKSGERVASWSCNLSASRAYFVLLLAWKWSMKIFQHRSTHSLSTSLQALVNSDTKAANTSIARVSSRNI